MGVLRAKALARCEKWYGSAEGERSRKGASIEVWGRTTKGEAILGDRL